VTRAGAREEAALAVALSKLDGAKAAQRSKVLEVVALEREAEEVRVALQQLGDVVAARQEQVAALRGEGV